MFDTGKVMLWEDYKKVNIFTMWMFAMAVSLSGANIFYPLDTIRRRLMMTSGTTGNEKLYSGTWDCVKKIYKHEGAAAFYKGCLSNNLRSAGGALLLVFYDKL